MRAAANRRRQPRSRAARGPSPPLRISSTVRPTRNGMSTPGAHGDARKHEGGDHPSSVGAQKAEQAPERRHRPLTLLCEAGSGAAPSIRATDAWRKSKIRSRSRRTTADGPARRAGPAAARSAPGRARACRRRAPRRCGCGARAGTGPRIWTSTNRSPATQSSMRVSHRIGMRCSSRRYWISAPGPIWIGPGVSTRKRSHGRRDRLEVEGIGEEPEDLVRVTREDLLACQHVLHVN